MRKLNEGKFTFQGMFKSEVKKVEFGLEIQTRMDQTVKDIDNWDVIRRFLIVYLAEIALPVFRKTKVSKYVQAMEFFSVTELTNAKKHQMCWGEFNKLTKLYAKERNYKI